jgi:hypothetical protein
MNSAASQAAPKTADIFMDAISKMSLTDAQKILNSGEMLAFDDDDNEVTRCVVEQWINNNDEDFYNGVEQTLISTFSALSTIADSLGILKPYSFVLENDDKDTIAELYIADDDTVIIGKDLMEGLDSDLNLFLEKLLG